MRLLLPLLMLLAFPAKAEEIVLGLSQDEVAITATFTGSEILIFGAIKREEPIPTDGELGIIIAVSGPLSPITVRRKEHRFGIWINVDTVEVDEAPSFYAVASSGPLYDSLRHVEDMRHSISIPRAIRSVGSEILDSGAFTEALIRIRTKEDLYQILEGAVDVEQETLFQTSIMLPSNLTEGDYQARIFLTRDGSVVDEYVAEIPVNKVGIERWLYELARNNAAIYGVMSLVIAIAAGWGASAAFSFFRR